MKRIVKLYYGHITNFTIDANKHPDVQISDLNTILENSSGDVEIYSNSPYVLFGLTLINSYVNSNIPPERNPYSNIIAFENKHFQINEDGTITEGLYYKKMMSDENLLNNKLAEFNEKFSDFLDLEDLLQP